MNLEELKQSVVLITSKNPKISGFGTGFVIHKAGWKAYILTCAHVLKVVCGTREIKIGDEVKVEMSDAMVIASDDERDLAVLAVDELPDSVALKCYRSDEKPDEKDGPFKTAGFFEREDKKHALRALGCNLGNQIVQVEGSDIQEWDLTIVQGSFPLERGYSGSPVLDKKDRVLGVVNTGNFKEGGRFGTAISIAELENFWKSPPDSDRLYCSLIKLDYRKQEHSFFQVIIEQANSVVAFAFLIHGEAEHGQQWLLNRLLNKLKEHLGKYTLPKRALKPIILDLRSRSLSNSIDSLWHRVGCYLRLGKSNPSEIARRVAQCCQRENVILIFDELNEMPKDFLDKLLKDFWMPLVKQVEASSQSGLPVLFMFLIDEEGRIEWNNCLPDAEKLDLTWKPYMPIKSPRISKFSKDILTDWIYDEYINLHLEIAKGFDKIAQEILEASEDGIPERVMSDICQRCDCNWEDELSKRLGWLKQ